MAACQNGAGAKKGRKKLYECQVQFVQNQGHQSPPTGAVSIVKKKQTVFRHSFQLSVNTLLYDCIPKAQCEGEKN